MITQSDSLLKLNHATIAGIVLAVNLGASADVRASSDADYNFLIDSDSHNCQQISTDYQEVYAFETASFHVNICHKNDVYFYSGEAKQSHTSSIFIPATPLENNRGFQARNGNVSYTVILPFSRDDSKPSALNRGEAILTIKRNQQLIAVESSLTKYCHPADAIALDEIKLNSVHSLNQIAIIPRQRDASTDLLSAVTNDVSSKVFAADSRFDFYRLDGKLHRLITCR